MANESPTWNGPPMDRENNYIYSDDYTTPPDVIRAEIEEFHQENLFNRSNGYDDYEFRNEYLGEWPEADEDDPTFQSPLQSHHPANRRDNSAKVINECSKHADTCKTCVGLVCESIDGKAELTVHCVCGFWITSSSISAETSVILSIVGNTLSIKVSISS